MLISEAVIHHSRLNTLLDLYNSSHHTQPHFIIFSLNTKTEIVLGFWLKIYWYVFL